MTLIQDHTVPIREIRLNSNKVKTLFYSKSINFEDNYDEEYGFVVYLFDPKDVIVDDTVDIHDITYESKFSEDFIESRLDPIMECRSEDTFLQVYNL